MRVIIALLLLAAGVLWLGKAEWLSIDAGNPKGSTPTGPAVASTATRDGTARGGARSEDFVVEITESELNRAVGARLTGRSVGATPLGEATLDNVRISLYQGWAEAAGAARLGGVSVPFSSRLTAAAESGGVRVAVSEAKLAGVALPESTRAGLETALQGEVDRLLSSQPVRVTRVEIVPGRLIASGTPRA